MAIKIAQLRQHLKELREQEAKLKAQILHTDGLIVSMARQNAGKEVEEDDSVPFEVEVRLFFEGNHNTPTKRAHVIRSIMTKYPMLTTEKARNKFIHLSRMGIVIQPEPKKYALAKIERQEQ